MRNRNALLVVAESLLYADQTVAAHAEVLRTAFASAPAMRHLLRLAGRTVAWTTKRPQPRARELAKRLRQDTTLRRVLERHAIFPAALPLPPRMRIWPGSELLPRLETVGELAAWLRIDVGYLLWLADLKDRNRHAKQPALQHYHCQAASKPDGSVRLLEAPKQHLKHVQRQILHEILDATTSHEAAHGFRKGRSILTFARPHVGKQVVLRLDLQEFFPSISGPRVQAMFRTLGYPERVADLLGGLCTTTTPHVVWGEPGIAWEASERQRMRVLYARPHLPQGAPTSPTIANLCALKVDRRLHALTAAAGGVYTRYADDLAFSGDGRFARSAGRFAAHAAAILSEEGFTVHFRKTRLMRASVRQHVAGLTVNEKPNLQRSEVDRLKAILTNCVRYGGGTQNREGHADFRRHLEGRVNFVAMVNATRGAALRKLLERITWE